MPVQISLKNKIYTIDGDDAPLLREAVATVLTESDTAAQELAKVKGEIASLEAKKAELETNLTKRDAELTAATTKLDEATKQLEEKTDEDPLDLNKIITERTALWNQVLPAIQKFDSEFSPNYALHPTEIKATYLLKTHADRAAVVASIKQYEGKLDGSDEQANTFIDALYLGLTPEESHVSKRSHADGILDDILNSKTGNTQTKADSKGGAVDFRKRLTEKIEANSKKASK